MQNSRIKAFVSIVSIAPILYLVGLAASFLLYLALPFPLTTQAVEPTLLLVGAITIVLSTGLVFWAERVSRRGAHLHTPSVDDFMIGPYRYTRHPGALGLMIMFIGFALVVNSLIMAILAAVFIILETFYFIPMEEATYMETAADAYTEYRKRVRMWI